MGAGGMVVGSTLTDQPGGSDRITTSETDTEQDSGSETDSGPGTTDTDSYYDSVSDVVWTTESDFDLGASDLEEGSIAIGTGGTVTGGYESTSLTDTNIETSVTTTATDTEISEDDRPARSARAATTARTARLPASPTPRPRPRPPATRRPSTTPPA